MPINGGGVAGALRQQLREVRELEGKLDTLAGTKGKWGSPEVVAEVLKTRGHPVESTGTEVLAQLDR